MVGYTLINVPTEKRLIDTKPQPYYRGHLILALDVRRQFLVISQTMSGIQAAIEEKCNQPISETCLYESSRRQLRKGLTHGTWSVIRMERDGAIEHYNSIRHAYAHRIVAARSLTQWQFE